jgi:hypothetical protein
MATVDEALSMPRLRASPRYLMALGLALVFIGLSASTIASLWRSDWANFWAAGATVGTPDLLNAHLHAKWQATHHLASQPFVYPPAVAWLFVPATHVSIDVGAKINSLVMIGVCLLSAFLAARVYRLLTAAALLSVFAWVPAVQAGFLGQFTPVALVLVLVATLGLTRQKPLLTGIAVGALLYKPTFGVPFLLLLAVRREWRALAVSSMCAGAWYLGSVLGTAGDWGWPATYWTVLHDYYRPDFARDMNMLKAISLPGLLLYAGASPLYSTIAGVALLLIAIPRLRHAPVLEVSSTMPLLALASSVHAYMYDAALALPSLLYVMSCLAEPWRTRLVLLAYTIAPSWILAPWIRFQPLAIVVVGGSILWLLKPFIVNDACKIRVFAYRKTRSSRKGMRIF